MTRRTRCCWRTWGFVNAFSDGLPELAHLPGSNPEGRRIASLVDEPRLRRILAIMLDEDEFLGPTGSARSRAGI
ncbi:MAG: hypothetical protein ACXVEY_13920 [Actinomycetota bacterium]